MGFVRGLCGNSLVDQGAGTVKREKIKPQRCSGHTASVQPHCEVPTALRLLQESRD